MRYGVTIFATDQAMPADEVAVEAEARGFDSLYLPEHTHIPVSRRTPPPTGDAELAEEYKRTVDPLIALAAAAARTTTLRLGTGVVLPAQREPIVTAKARGAKRAVLLPVSAPFHCALMKPAAERLEQALAGIEVRVPTIPVLNNVDVAVEDQPERIKDALVRQAYSPVRWIETVQAIAGRGVTHVFECGPGKVLAGMTKRIEASLQGGAIADVASLEDILKITGEA